MLRVYNKLLQSYIKNIRKYQLGIKDLWHNQKGDLVSALGWMAITAVMLVAISAILSGKMTDLVNSIFIKLEGLLI